MVTDKWDHEQTCQNVGVPIPPEPEEYRDSWELVSVLPAPEEGPNHIHCFWKRKIVVEPIMINIDGKDYPIDSSGAKPKKYYNEGICWILNGKFHRVDGAAIIFNNGIKEWHQIWTIS